MKHLTVADEKWVTGEKKPYTRPEFRMVQLVASEAVLALCKYNSPGQGVNVMCAPDLSCISTARS